MMSDIRCIQVHLKEKRISARELASVYLAACRAENDTLHAYISLTEEQAYAAADATDRQLRQGEDLSPLTGIPLCVKDNICVTGTPTTCASEMLKNYYSPYNAFVADLLLSQNALLLGKTNMDEFAMGSTCRTSCFGGAVHPRHRDCVTGGSSGGTACAVAAGLALCGLGSDTGGSIRQPAAFCGLVGLKPTYGAVSRRGLVAFASSLDQIGPMARTAEDCAILLDAITKKDSRDMTSRALAPVLPRLKNDIRGLRIGLAPEFFEGTRDCVAAAAQETIRTLRSMGAETVEIAFPELRFCLSAYYVLACAEAASNLGRYDGLRYGPVGEGDTFDQASCDVRGRAFGAEVQRRVLLGSYVLRQDNHAALYERALAFRDAVRNRFNEIFQHCDCVLTPTTPFPAPTLTELTQDSGIRRSDLFTVPANLAGLPAITFPCGFDKLGRSIGIQLIGNPMREDLLLSTAMAFERDTGGMYLCPAEVKL